MPQLNKERQKKYNYLITALIVVAVISIFHLWLHLTNPYASWNIIRQPYTTTIKNDRIVLEKQFTLHAYASPFAAGLGYYKSGFLIAQNTYFGSRPAPSSQPDEIINYIHTLRFNPSKPYLISGDQFSVLYPRNLGVFYNSLLDPNTAHSQQDWENRQRIYLQSVLYALDAFSEGDTLTTTVVPTGPRAVALTEVHPGSVPSDTLYGMFYALDRLQNETASSNAQFKLQTTQTVRELIQERQDDLNRLLSIYLQQAQDPSTGFAKKDAHLAAARDGVTRESSLYDNIVLWKTLEIANRLGIRSLAPEKLENMRTTLVREYWDEAEGHFKDDLREHASKENYSSDWLIALPTGFLSPSRPEDLPYLKRIVQFIREENIAKPFPIKYQATLSAKDVPWAVKTFVPNYGGDAIWSYWGAEYITLLANLYGATHDKSYINEAREAITTYNQKMSETRGFPETFAPDGSFLENNFYKSIRQTGWVVQFETAKEKVESFNE
jgi:hypothetical protein